MKNLKIGLTFFYFLFFIFLAFFSFNVSSDFWWHLSSGKQIILNKGLPEKDNFYCAGEYKWYNHEWLFNIIIYKIYEKFNLFGIKIFFILIFLLVVFFIFLNSYIISKKTFEKSFIITCLSLFFLLPFTEERPQIFSMLFFSFFILIYFNLKDGFIKYFFIIFITLVWVNIHYTVSSFLYVIFIDILFTKNKRKIFLLFFLFIVSIMNPDGIKIFDFFSKEIEIKKYIKEWQGIFNFKNISVNYLIYELLFLINSFFIFELFIKNLKNENKLFLFKNLIIILPFFLLCIISKRVIIFFAILLPLLSNYLSNILVKNEKFILSIFIFFLLFIISLSNKVNDYYPYKIIKFLKEDIKNECIFTSFEIGGFAEFFLYPDNKIFLNGRLNISKNILYEYSIIYYCEDNFIEIIRKYNIKYFILPYNSLLFKYFISNNLKPLLYDEKYGLFFIEL